MASGSLVWEGKRHLHPCCAAGQGRLLAVDPRVIHSPGPCKTMYASWVHTLLDVLAG